MPNQDDAHQIEAEAKMVKLASRVKRTTTSYSEDVKIGQAVKAGKIKNRSDLSRVLQESLNVTERDVLTAMASDDTDRLADEIISLLGGK